MRPLPTDQLPGAQLPLEQLASSFYTAPALGQRSSVARTLPDRAQLVAARPEDVLRKLYFGGSSTSNIQDGLSSEDARRLLSETGINDPVTPVKQREDFRRGPWAVGAFGSLFFCSASCRPRRRAARVRKPGARTKRVLERRNRGQRASTPAAAASRRCAHAETAGILSRIRSPLLCTCSL